MIEYDKDKWLSPADAAKEMSRRAGYEITVDDIRQLKRTGKITSVWKLGKRITLYDRKEIQTVKPPKKRKPQPIEDVPMAA